MHLQLKKFTRRWGVGVALAIQKSVARLLRRMSQTHIVNVVHFVKGLEKSIIS